jgi:hypothetical protein
MATTEIINIVLTGIIAVATITYTVVTAFLLMATKKSVEFTQQALYLTVFMREVELVFEETALNPDGTQRHGAERAPSRMALHRFRGKVRKFREEMEKNLTIKFDYD